MGISARKYLWPLCLGCGTPLNPDVRSSERREVCVYCLHIFQNGVEHGKREALEILSEAIGASD